MGPRGRPLAPGRGPPGRATDPVATSRRGGHGLSASEIRPAPAAVAGRLDELLAARLSAGAAYFAERADALARLCHRMAERFSRGGRLLAFGATPAARSDARHVAVEFVHPVIVGKRALPAIAVGPEGGALEPQARLLAEPDDVAIGFGEAGDGEVAAALEVARSRGCLTVGFGPGGAEWDLRVPAGDPFVAQELAETAYHVLWELVHVFFEHRGLLEGRRGGSVHDTGASSFLYPFLGEQEHDLDAVVADVRASVLMKAEEVGALRSATLTENREALALAAELMARSFAGGGRVLALGNGGSATDAMDAVADLREPPSGWPARPALDLTEDPAILTAILNDIGAEAIFSRQVIAHGREGDVLLALSTSGNSGNVLAALAEARRHGMATVALVGYDGGRVAAEGLADAVIVSRSQHIPRIQEAQASAWHALRELVATHAIPLGPGGGRPASAATRGRRRTSGTPTTAADRSHRPSIRQDPTGLA